MKRACTFCASVFLVFSLAWVLPSFGESSEQDLEPGINSDIETLKKDVKELKDRLEAEKSAGGKNNALISAVSGLQITGGISGGYFYASNPGKDTSDSEFLLSNLLVELSSKKKDEPLQFEAAFGETSTPSLFAAPSVNSDYDIEYASLSLKPMNNLILKAGLLKPSAGYEDTYTFNNRNIVLGAVASQQPYNAYGARASYSFSGFNMEAGYYKSRLDRQEYATAEICPNDSWELGLAGTAFGLDFHVYNYHINGMKNLTGVVIEHTIKNIYLAFDVDYWRWDSSMRNTYGGRSSIGAAFYLSPRFGKISVPLRIEYIDQGRSRIYTESTAAKHIYAATLTPTYNFSEHAYARVGGAYISADRAFQDKSGNVKDGRIYLSAELGLLF